MYETVCTKVTRTYGQADQWLRDQYRRRYITSNDQPKIIHINATNLTPNYYAVMVRVHIADRRW